MTARTMVWTRLLRRLVDLVPVAQLDGLPVVVVITDDQTAFLSSRPGEVVMPVARVVHNRRHSRIELHTCGDVDQGDPGDGAYPGEERPDALPMRLQAPGFDWHADDAGTVPWTAADERDLQAAERGDRG